MRTLATSRGSTGRPSRASSGPGREQATRKTPAKTKRTVPLKFKDNETGEILDVIQDNDRGLPPEADPQVPDRSLDRFLTRR